MNPPKKPIHDEKVAPPGCPEVGTLVYVRLKVVGYPEPWHGVQDAYVVPVSKGGIPIQIRGKCPPFVIPPEFLIPAKMAADEQALYVNVPTDEPVPAPD